MWKGKLACIHIFMLRVLCYLLYSVECKLRTGAPHCSINRERGSILVIRRLGYTLFTTAYNPLAHPFCFLGELFNYYIHLCIAFYAFRILRG